MINNSTAVYYTVTVSVSRNNYDDKLSPKVCIEYVHFTRKLNIFSFRHDPLFGTLSYKGPVVDLCIDF